MDYYRVGKAFLQGALSVPPSKSQTLRALLFGALGKGVTRIHNYLNANDSRAMIEACQLLGAKVELKEHIIIDGLNGHVRGTSDVINAGNSGIVLRFCAAIGALAEHPVVLTGDHSIRYQRPMRPLLEGLSQLGVSAVSMRGDGFAPVIIRGPLQPGKAIVNGEDSQPVSALLMAAAFAEGPIELAVENAGERPWVELTLSWFDRLGIPYYKAGDLYRLGGRSRYEGFDYKVPGDFSSAAFPLAAALITGGAVTLNNISWDDAQGDKELVTVLQKMGAQIEITETGLVVKGDAPLGGLKVDINNFIDALPILAVVACFAEGETHIYNARIAGHKECNRLHAMSTELRKMGASIEETQDGLIVQKSSLKGAKLHSYHDHRIAMALTVAALGAEGESQIEPISCIAKTYPTFQRDLNQLGATIR